MVSRNVLADVALAVLGVVTVASAGYVLLREPQPVDAGFTAPLPTAAASASARPSPVALPTPSQVPIDVVLLRSATTPSGHVVAAGEQLGWRLTNQPLESVTPPVLEGQELVLLQAGQDDVQRVVEAVEVVRGAAPSARLVVVAPLSPVRGGQAQDALARAAQQSRATLLDPAALGWLQDPAGAFAPNGSFTPEGARSVGAQLAAALD